ncbi:hypothetical protein AWZ03_005564 [Drosophila navojoa]|uniref:Uncharacterized protein n=1 Tax=Drosophila navojoa TaxID=7232 RepID=A0A484BGF4_DRONA|nr:hypothetical protein AWZ03_005564 [Drosophila navojoa]
MSLEECLAKMSKMTLVERGARESLERMDSSNPSCILNTTPVYCDESSDSSDSIQSAPELFVEQRKIENARLYPLEVKLYWTYEEVGRGLMKKKRKRRVDLYTERTVKRKKFFKEWPGTPTVLSPKQELGYEADDEN